MLEIPDASTDLIYTSPPYNIGTTYGDFKDNASPETYKKLLVNVFRECSRVAKGNGLLVLECADSVLSEGTFVELAGYIQSLCIHFGFKLKERHINFVNTREGVERTDHFWNDDYTTRRNAHSNCHQVLAFSKSAETIFSSGGEILYANYRSDNGHPCPMPPDMSNFILDRFFKVGMVVADPFMGTARLGVEVIRRGGIFFGYEIDHSIFELARGNLLEANLKIATSHHTGGR